MADDRILNRLKLHDLRIMLAVTETGSMAKAATQLATSQPAISRAIAQMEATLGVVLLERSSQGVEPTPYGRALIKRSVAVFDELRQGVKEIESIADPTTGEVRIGCNPLLAASFVSAVIDRLSRSYPRMTFHHVTAYGTALYVELIERNVDLLVARKFRFANDEQFKFEFLCDDAYVVVVGTENPWARRRKIALADLVDELWVMRPAESVVGAVAIEAFRGSGLDQPRMAVVTDSPEVRWSLLATGRFLTIVPASALRFPTRRPEVVVLPIKLPVAPVPSEIVTLKNRALSPAAQLFIDCARKVAKPFGNGR
jgi:DNA-binding transcriptional LysR family regulator